LGLGGDLQCVFILDAKGVESETPKASRGYGVGTGYPLLQPTRGLGSVIRSSSGVRDGAPAEIELCKIWIW